MKFKIENAFCVYVLFFSLQPIHAQLSIHNSGNTVGSDVYETDLADVNNDGYIDCFTIPVSVWDANGNGGTVDYGKLYLNNGDGTFSFKQNIGRVGCQYIHADFADLDNDDNLDIVVAHDGYKNEVWLNDGQGNFTKNQQFGIEPSNGIKLGDLNGDGAIDAVVSNYHYAWDGMTNYQPDEIWLNDGTGTFTLDTSFCRSMATATLCDINADNDFDIIFGDTIWLNDGNAHFQKIDGEIWQNSFGTFVYDFNNDNYPDIFVTKWEEPSEIWLNNGDLTFSKALTLSEDCMTLSSYFFDVDNDGDIDIFEGNSSYNSQPGILWINQCDLPGAIGPFVKSETSYPTGFVSIADLTNNGELDAIFENEIWLAGVLGIKETKVDDLFNISPNPVIDKVTLEFMSDDPENVSVFIYNASGTCLHQASYKSGQIKNLDFSTYPEGSYIIKVNANERFQTGLVVKQ